MLITTLKQIGLTEKQAKIYLACLELGEASIKEIAKKAEVKRTTIYDFIDEMVSSGYLKQTVKGKKTRYIAIDPDELKIIIKKREALLSQILPDLRSINNNDKTKPKIWFYHGEDGLKEVYSDALKYSTEILALGGEDTINVLGHEWILGYIKKRIKKAIHCRGIVARSEFVEREYVAKDKEQFRTSKLIDANKYPFSVEINIYGHRRVFLVSAKDKIGVIIESQEIYNTMKSMFEFMWDHLPAE